MADINHTGFEPSPGAGPPLPGGEDEALAALIACFGADALDHCAAVVQCMAHDPALAARVAARHARLGEQLLHDDAGCTLAAAREAGRRAMLLVLLLESEPRYLGR